MGSERLAIFNDESRRVTVGVFFSKTPSQTQHHFDVAAEVPEDMVCVGGGGEAVNLPHGALLTASYPNENLSAWLVSSKDHGQDTAQNHFLSVYAIGLAIQGMSREQLLDAIHISTNESGDGQHPEATATILQNYVLLGGGFNINWYREAGRAGNLATASFPSSSLSWTARSKDHGDPSPANLRVFAIGLREDLPVGRVVGAIEYQTSSAAQHPAAIADMTPGFALTGGGAQANWRTNGSLLWKMRPRTDTGNQEFSVSSKDHRAAEVCTITAYALGIKIVRPG